MSRIEIDKERCKGCELCVIHCPRVCISVDASLNKRGVHPAVFNEDGSKCSGCAFCAIVCPDVCIEVYK